MSSISVPRSWRRGRRGGPPLLGVACSGGDPTLESGNSDAGVATFDLFGHVPHCSRARSGQVYYVRSEEQFYYCDGRRLRPIELDGDPDESVVWLTATSSAEESDCANGGVLIHVGPDSDGDGALWGRSSPRRRCAMARTAHPGRRVSPGRKVNREHRASREATARTAIASPPV